jgi:hypothetical protein
MRKKSHFRGEPILWNTIADMIQARDEHQFGSVTQREQMTKLGHFTPSEEKFE